MKNKLLVALFLITLMKSGFSQWNDLSGYKYQSYNECYMGKLDFDVSPDNSIYVITGYEYCDSPHYYWYRVARSSDSGAQWSFLNFSDYTSYSGIQCVEENEIVMLKTDQLTSKIYTTSDNFVNLTQIAGSSVDGYFNDLDFISLDRGFVLNSYPWELIGKVEDGIYSYTSGDTVSFKSGHVELVNDTTAYLLCRDLFIPDPNQSGNNLLLKTTDFGNSWTMVYHETGYDLNHCCFVNEEEGIMVGKSGKILNTTDGGTTWNSMNSGVTSEISFITSKNGQNFCVGKNGLILRNQNGEADWEDISFGTMNYTRIGLDDNNTGYLLASGQYLSESKILISGVALSTSVIPEKNTLLLYPNPCSDKIYIDGSGNVQLRDIRIFNTTGQLVCTFPDDSGRVLDVSSLHNGLYFISAVIGDHKLSSRFLKTGN